MKVIHLISGGDSGGAKTHVLSLLRNLNETITAQLVCFRDGPFADEARARGVHTDRLRLAVILSATVLTASAVSVSGMIGWVGLVIPHLSRRIVGNDCRWLLPMSMLFGAAFLLLVDNMARCLTAVEIPIGILTAFVGAPFFIYLMIKGGDRV